MITTQDKRANNTEIDYQYAGIYARASTNMQGDTIEHQVSIIQEWSKRFDMPFKFDERYIFRDEGESAYKTTLLERPEMKKLLECVEDESLKVIIFKGVSRFARNSAEAISTIEVFKDRGIRVISIEENFDSNKDDPMFFQMYAVIAEAESRKTAIRVSMGNKQKARNGIAPNTTLPLGYSRVKNLKDESLKKKLLSEGVKPNSIYPNEEAYVVKKIFQMYVEEGLGRQQICNWLNDNGYKTTKGNTFDATGIARILSNRLYVGDVIYGKTIHKFINSKDGSRKIEKKVPIDKKDWAIALDAHPAIIEREVFYKAELIQKDREEKFKTKGKFNSAKHPLVGILKCGKCGGVMVCHVRKTMTKKGEKIYRYYTCNTKGKKGISCCNQPNIKADKLEETVSNYIQSEIEKLKDRFNNVKSRTIRNEGRLKELQSALKTIEGLISKKMRAMKTLLDERDSFDDDTYQEMKNMYQEEIRDFKEKKAGIESELSSFTINENGEDMEEAFNKFMKAKLEGRYTIDKRRMFHEWVKEIVILEKDIESIELKHM